MSPSSGDPFVIVMPMPVNLGNARLHWRTKLESKKGYFAMCDTLASVHNKAGLPTSLPYRVVPPPPVPMGRVLCSAHMVLGGPMDDDNAMARLKFALDWLVRRGYLTNDNRQWLTWAGLPAQTVSRSVPSHITFTFTPQS